MPKSTDLSKKDESEWRKTMGKRIRSARKGAGYQQNEFAEKIGVKPSTACGWEKGKYSPRAEHIRKIVSLTGESSAYIQPEKLGKKDTIEWMSRDLGAVLGKARLRRLLELPETQIRREVDAMIGQHLVEAQTGTHGRKR